MDATILSEARRAAATAPIGVSIFNRDFEPKSSDFQDGQDAEGYFMHDGILYEQVCGSSGVYLIETDIASGTVLRDQRPWQMTV